MGKQGYPFTKKNYLLGDYLVSGARPNALKIYNPHKKSIVHVL